MYQKDYFMRMIEQITQTIANQIFQLKQAKKFEEALDRVGELYARLSLPNSDMLKKLSAEQIVQMLTIHEIKQPEKIQVLADLLEEEAELRGHLDQEEQRVSALLTAIELRLYLWKSDPTAANPEQIVQSVEKLNDYLLPADTGRTVVELYMELGQYGKAEDLLFQLLGDHPNEDLLEEAIAMYEQLLLKPESELIAGNLTFQEVQEALIELLSLKKL